jgi:hypothetical protein
MSAAKSDSLERLVGMIPCRAHGGVPGGECYYSLAMDPPCGETPCMIEPGPVVGGIKTYKRRIHPNILLDGSRLPNSRGVTIL